MVLKTCLVVTKVKLLYTAFSTFSWIENRVTLLMTPHVPKSFFSTRVSTTFDTSIFVFVC